MNFFRPTALAAVALTFFLTADHASAQEPEYYELRTYRLASQEKADAFDKTFGPALVEAMQAEAIWPIGIFKPVEVKEEDKGEVLRYVLMPYKNIDQWAKIGDKLKANGTVWEPALDFLMAEKSDPNYSRIDSSLLVAFDGMPKLVLPEKPKDAERRHFEIRVYESHSVVKGALKVEMFNKGEFDIFKKTGLKALFFGQAKVAKNLPQLTYMLVYDSEEARKKAWKDFLAHPEWKKLKANERYKDTVSKITSRFVKATEYSQIK